MSKSKASWLKVNSSKNSLCETADFLDLDFSQWEQLYYGTLKVQEKRTSKFHLVTVKKPRPNVRLGLAGDLYWVIDNPDVYTGPSSKVKST